MRKITKLQKSERIDYSYERVKFFERENEANNLNSYESIIQKIKNSNKILLASTSDIYEEIIDATYQKNPYIILKSFNEKTLNRFNKNNSAIIREVEELENDFIIIDNESYIFLNPLSEKENIFFEIDVKDANLIFSYYFWDMAKKEYFIDVIKEPNSPYTIGKRSLENVNIGEIEKKIVYAPINLKYRKEMKYEENFICEDLTKAIYQNDTYTQVAKFAIKQKLPLKNYWKLKEKRLGEISLNKMIIPFNSEKKIYVKNQENIYCGEIKANTIEKMENIKPVFEKKDFIKIIEYHWTILPPKKPQNAKKAKIYEEFEKLRKDIEKYCNEIEDKIKYLLKKAKLGEKKKLEESLSKTHDFKHKNIKKLSKVKLEDFIEEFEIFYNHIFESEQKPNELENLQKKQKKIRLTIPKYILPEVGVLYENSETYFLEIEYYEELQKANELKQRYINKNYKVVAKD